MKSDRLPSASLSHAIFEGAGILVLVSLVAVLLLAACGTAEPAGTPPSVVGDQSAEVPTVEGGSSTAADLTPVTGPLSAADHLKQGNQFVSAGEFDKSIAEYQAALDMEPDNVDALSNLGVVYYNTGRLDEAIAQYDKALSLAPKDADLHSNLAAAYVQKYLSEQATDYLDKALSEYLAATELNPNLAEAYFGLGVVYLQTDDKDKALSAFETFTELDQGQDPMASDQAKKYLEELKGQ